MRLVTVILAMVLISCNQAKQPVQEKKSVPASHKVQAGRKVHTYSNARFRNVTLKKMGNDTFAVTGEAQIFEATFAWVVEDGHNELEKGFTMTDAGAPAWGKFSFDVSAVKKPNTSLTLLLFEISAKDGSRQHELAIPLK